MNTYINTNAIRISTYIRRWTIISLCGINEWEFIVNVEYEISETNIPQWIFNILKKHYVSWGINFLFRSFFSFFSKRFSSAKDETHSHSCCEAKRHYVRRSASRGNHHAKYEYLCALSSCTRYKQRKLKSMKWSHYVYNSIQRAIVVISFFFFLCYLMWERRRNCKKNCRIAIENFFDDKFSSINTYIVHTHQIESSGFKKRSRIYLVVFAFGNLFLNSTLMRPVHLIVSYCGEFTLIIRGR